MFPVRSEFNPKDADDNKSEERHLLNQVIQGVTNGFTSSEYKLNQLQ